MTRNTPWKRGVEKGGAAGSGIGNRGPPASGRTPAMKLIRPTSTPFWPPTASTTPAGTARLPGCHIGDVRQAHRQHEPPAVPRLGVTRHRLHQGLPGPPDRAGLESLPPSAVPVVPFVPWSARDRKAESYRPRTGLHGLQAVVATLSRRPRSVPRAHERWGTHVAPVLSASA
jgi:hypothetical protein